MVEIASPAIPVGSEWDWLASVVALESFEAFVAIWVESIVFACVGWYVETVLLVVDDWSPVKTTGFLGSSAEIA